MSAVEKQFSFKLENFKINKQIGLISLVAFLGLSFIGGNYGISYRKQSLVEQELEHSSKELELVNEVNYKFLNARRVEKDFIIRHDEKYVGRHHNNSKQVHADILEMKENVSVAEDIQILEDFEQGYLAYDKQFAQVVENVRTRGLTYKDGLEGKLREAVHTAESKLKTYQSPELTASMLMMRRYEKDFMLRKDSKYVESMAKQLKDFKKKLSYFGASLAEKKELFSLLSDYHKAFNELAKMELKNDEDIKELSKVYAIAAPKLESLSARISERNEKKLKEAEEIAGHAFTGIVSAIVCSTVLCLFLAIVIGRKISQPVVALSDCLLELSENNLDVNVPGQQRKDEIGDMAKSVEVLRENSIKMRELEAEQKLEQEKQLVRAEKLEMLTNDFENSVSELISTLSSASTELGSTAQSMSSVAEETTAQATSMTEASQETSGNINTVASASEELSASIKELSSQVHLTSQATNSATDDVNKTSKRIEGLLEASEKIGEVIELIQGIAEQTNLLALNATIESARAGDAGKGFAVVASEVKNLAQETSKATEQIGEEVNLVQNEIRNAVDAIKNIETKINDVNSSTTAIAAAIEEQEATTDEITRNTHSSASNIEELSSNADNLNIAAQTTGTSANDVLIASSELSKQTEVLKTKVSDFLSQVKAA